jgi:FAD/FMN-containing dehydrogenase
MKRHYQSWGRQPRVEQDVVRLWSRHDPFPHASIEGKNVLPRGNGRSYGDSCLNDGGILIDMRGLDRFIAFDPDTGILRCEAGVLLADILELVVPLGWFIPSTPGTQLITVGGAIANDVHGKAHHRDGTFGRHVRCFELLRSDGSRRLCSPSENREWYEATIGGLGLTGVILWAEITLKPIANPYIESETIKCANLDDFLEVSAESDQDYEYTVAWLDCSASGPRLGRALFTRGNHAPAGLVRAPRPPKRGHRFPIEPPVSLVNGVTLRAFNSLYYNRQRQHRQRTLVHYAPFFYPLDAVLEWNRIYGPQGFFQYQCVLPGTDARPAVREVLERIAASGESSFLAVMKVFGDVPSPGILSFPREGVTLAVDFPNRGARTLALMERLDAVVRAAGGRNYPAKDARMSIESFQQFYPRWRELPPFIDPRFSSSFWRRVTGAAL